MIIEKFKPLEFSRNKLNIDKLNKETGVNWKYASSGKAALYHCLKSLNVTGSILIPVYVCASILRPISKLGLRYVCYDVDIQDMNADVVDIENKIIENKIECLLVASLYGTPVNIEAIEKICRRHNIFLIDDAAQSFGAKYNNKYIGTFGDAGFFSFSPGKATPGHLGAFFWSKNGDYTFKRKNNYFLHKIAYWDYYFNRYNIYLFKKYRIFKMLTYLNYFIFRIFNTYNDQINEFEKSLLGGILFANFNQNFRTKYIKYIKKELKEFTSIRLITLGSSTSNNHKIVFICDSIELAQSINSFMNKSGVYVSLGYKLLSFVSNCPNGKQIYSRVIEIPLENSKIKNEYIVKQLKQILNK